MNAQRKPRAADPGGRGGNDASKNAPMSKRRRRRPRRAEDERGRAAPQAVVKAATSAQDAPAHKSVDEPLTAAETKRIKEHLRFLREHRKLLKLKVNANEDLLLNDKREPTRGAVQHLLSKVDYSQVASVTSRIPAAERPALLAGLLRFKTELAYVLLYLESLKDSAHVGAAAALESALDHIDFGEISAGQMGRLLDLIVELFNDAERAALLLSLLESRTFRVAFDDSVAQLPAGLAGLVAPLGALHRSLYPKPGEALPTQADVTAGVGLLLRAGMPGFGRRPRAVQARLLELSLRSVPNALTEHAPCLERMLDVFEDDAARYEALGFDYIVRLVRAGQDKRARMRLKAFASRFDQHDRARQLSVALAAPRIGRIARLSEAVGDANSEQLQSGFDLDALQYVWLRTGDAAALKEHASQIDSLALPRVARLQRVELGGDRPYLTIERLGSERLGSERLGSEQLGSERLGDAPRPSARTSALMTLRQLSEIASALALAGTQLPDLAAHRFELDAAGAPVLVDLWGCHSVPSEHCVQVHLELATSQIARLRLLSAAELDRVRAADSFSALIGLLTSMSAIDAEPRRARARKRRRRRKSGSDKPGSGTPQG